TLTSLGMRARWQREGPAGIASAVRRRNRLFALVLFVLLVVLAFLEAVSVDVHEGGLMALQYGVGDAAGSDPVGVWETAS
ncbi:hypothetical protein, partial [Klebsiella pneumoniae]|uniref:hypothetical protein n=1 Tax=Klebsiella pneumoniae TaxID=573 RepID=UPI0029365B9D